MTTKSVKRHKKLFYSVSEAAQIIGVHPNTMYNAINAGSVPGVIKIGRRIVISKKVLDAAYNEPAVFQLARDIIASENGV